MAVNAPSPPSLIVDDQSRTLTSINLKFVPGVSNGGSLITGYLLYRDQGVAGSPFSLLYNGTGSPDIIFFNATELVTSHYYLFRLYSRNAIFLSSSYAEAQVLVATVPE